MIILLPRIPRRMIIECYGVDHRFNLISLISDDHQTLSKMLFANLQILKINILVYRGQESALDHVVDGDAKRRIWGRYSVD